MAYTSAANAIRSASKKTGRVNIPTITPSVLISTLPAGGITDAVYDPGTRSLVLFKMQDSVVKNIPVSAERSVKVNIHQSHIEAGVQL